MPRVSVIIPAYNAQAYVARALNSVLAQTYRDYEILVVDDGSTDGTRAVVERYGQRVRYVHQPNRERSAARNNGIRRAEGELFAFLDADDYWAPHKLERQIALLDEHPGLGLVFAWAAALDPWGGKVLRFLGTDFPAEGAPGLDAFEALALRTSPPTLTVVARADCVHEAGLFDENVCEIEDWDLWLRISVRQRLGFVPEVLAFYRLSGLFKPIKLAAAEVPEKWPGVVRRAFALAQTVPGREGVLHLQNKALARAHLKAALVHYAVGNASGGSDSLERAQAADGALFAGDAGRFVYELTDFALNLYDTWTPPTAAASFLEDVFGNLPSSLRHLAGLKRATLRMVAAGHGYRAWVQGEPALARNSLLRAVVRYPELARNLGLWSIGLRSLFGGRAGLYSAARRRGED